MFEELNRFVARMAVALIGLIAATASAAAQDSVARGEYLVRAAGCIACHTDEKSGGAQFAGGRALPTPFGTFYSSNITPDPETGIGNWSDADFITALREGRSPEGHLLYPVFPYSSYTKMRDEDMLAIKAYLFAQPPVQQENKTQEPNFPLGWRFLLNGWKVLNFESGPIADDPAQSEAWNRGRYLVEALAHCSECHTPRTLTGGLDQDLYLAGTADGPEGEKVPNITPAESGIADWSETDIAYLLKEGLKPNYDNVQGSMAEAIDDGLKYLTDEDLNAIATYLKSIPPIEHKVGK
ncbi:MULTISPECIES: c-type cytochrome [unclassified Hwanghaeella]|uniref:c-type cytochrome n=1 Tax=unclassified Hwanghaeella TaxID=2605944 RepID=UPI003B678D11